MKRFILLATIAAAASLVQAQNQAGTAAGAESAVRIPAPHNSIELPARPHHLFRGDFDVYRGTYSLSNGEELTLKQRGRQLFATLSGREEKELVAAAHNVFVAKDRNLKITLFTTQGNDEIGGEVVIRYPRTVADIDAGREARVERFAVR